MNGDDFTVLEDRLSGLLDAVEPAGRRRLALSIAVMLKRRQSDRIAAQQNPDGTPYEPRKPQSRLRNKRGALRRRMFDRLRTTRWMKHEATDAAAVVTFAPGAQRIARVHQLGLRDRVNKTSLTVQYAKRELLGMTDGDIDAVEDLVLSHMAGSK